MTGVAGAPVDGTVDPAFAPVREVFTDLLRSGRETGAAVAVWAGGRLVADLWGGWADAARTSRGAATPSSRSTRSPSRSPRWRRCAVSPGASSPSTSH
jgi:hypothetical protein